MHHKKIHLSLQIKRRTGINAGSSRKCTCTYVNWSMHMKSFPFKLLTAAAADPADVDKTARATAAGVQEAKRVACTAMGLVKAAANMMMTSRDNTRRGRREVAKMQIITKWYSTARCWIANGSILNDITPKAKRSVQPQFCCIFAHAKLIMNAVCQNHGSRLVLLCHVNLMRVCSTILILFNIKEANSLEGIIRWIGESTWNQVPSLYLSHKFRSFSHEVLTNNIILRYVAWS